MPSACVVEQDGQEPLAELLTDDVIDELVTRTRNGGAEVVALLKTGSAYYAPSAAAARMARAVAEDSGAVLPVCAWVDGEYGISGVYLAEAEIGASGVRRIVERDLTDSERTALREAAEAVRAKQADVDSPLMTSRGIRGLAVVVVVWRPPSAWSSGRRRRRTGPIPMGTGDLCSGDHPPGTTSPPPQASAVTIELSAPEVRLRTIVSSSPASSRAAPVASSFRCSVSWTVATGKPFPRTSRSSPNRGGWHLRHRHRGRTGGAAARIATPGADETGPVERGDDPDRLKMITLT